MKNFKKGFTIVEIVVYTGVLSIIISSFIPFFLWTMRAYYEGKRTKEIVDNAQRAMTTIVREIKKADSVYTPTTTNNQLSLRKRIDSSEQPVFTDFFICDKNICFKKESQEPIILTSEKIEITNLKFTEIGSPPQSVKIEMEFDFKDYAKGQEHKIISTSSLRNY